MVDPQALNRNMYSVTIYQNKKEISLNGKIFRAPLHIFTIFYCRLFADNVVFLHECSGFYGTLQRQNTEISKQIFPEKEYRGLSPNFHIHASVSDLYISTICLPILLEEKCR